LSGYIFATKACIDTRKKNLLSSNISSTYAHNMVNFGPLAAEIVSGVWGTWLSRTVPRHTERVRQSAFWPIKINFAKC